MTCIIVGHQPHPESHFVAAHLRFVVLRISVGLKISAGRKTRGVQKINVAQRISVVLTRTIIHLRPLIILQHMPSQTTCRLCSRDLLQFMHLSMNFLRLLLHKRSMQLKSENVTESDSITPLPPPPLLGSLKGLLEKWMSMKITMMTERMKRREG
jgi:hypothetical protein